MADLWVECETCDGLGTLEREGVGRIECPACCKGFVRPGLTTEDVEVLRSDLAAMTAERDQYREDAAGVWREMVRAGAVGPAPAADPEGERPSLEESLERLREASGYAFDRIEDVGAFVRGLRGEDAAPEPRIAPGVPAAIYIDSPGIWHGYESQIDAVKDRGDSIHLELVREWHWHPASARPGAAKSDDPGVPAAIVKLPTITGLVRDRDGQWHAFEDPEGMRSFVANPENWRIAEWLDAVTWHPGKASDPGAGAAAGGSEEPQ